MLDGIEEKLSKIKNMLEEKNYKITQTDVEVRKNVISIWNCPPEDKLRSFVNAIFDLLKKLEFEVNPDFAMSFPPASKAKDLEETIKILWDVKKSSVIREDTDNEIKDKLLSNYGDGKSRIFAGDANPRAIVNLDQELFTNNLSTERIQGAKFIQASFNIDVKESIQKVMKLKADKLNCSGMRLCGKYSEEELVEDAILITTKIVCDGCIENSYVSFGSEKSNDILTAKKTLEEKKYEAINFFNDKAILIRRQIIMDHKFGLTIKDKKWIKFMFEQAQKDYKKSEGKESILDYLVDILTQQHSDIYVGEVKIVNGRKFKMKREVVNLKKEKERMLQKMDELKEKIRTQEQEIVEYKEKIRKEYWVKKLYLKKPFGEYWPEQLEDTFGKKEDYREELKKSFGKFISITTSIEVFDNCPDYHSLLTIYRSFGIIHKEMTKKLVELVTKNKEYIDYLSGDAAKSKEPNLLTNSLNKSAVRLDYNDFALIKGVVSHSKIFGGTNNRLVVLGSISESELKCDDISVMGSIDLNSKITTKYFNAERCGIGIKICTGPGSRILSNGDEYLEEYEFKNFGKNVMLSEVPGRHNVFELSFS